MKVEKNELSKYLKDIYKYCKIYDFNAAMGFKLSEMFQNIKEDRL